MCGARRCVEDSFRRRRAGGQGGVGLGLSRPDLPLRLVPGVSDLSRYAQHPDRDGQRQWRHHHAVFARGTLSFPKRLSVSEPGLVGQRGPDVLLEDEKGQSVRMLQKM